MHCVQWVLAAAPPSSDQEDKMIWSSSGSGEFSTASAYQVVQQGENSSRLFSFLWHWVLPLKVSFFMVRLMRGRLPIMGELHKFGIGGPSRCFCCPNPSQETIDHTFCMGLLDRSGVSLNCRLASLVKLL